MRTRRRSQRNNGTALDSLTRSLEGGKPSPLRFSGRISARPNDLRLLERFRPLKRDASARQCLVIVSCRLRSCGGVGPGATSWGVQSLGLGVAGGLWEPFAFAGSTVLGH